MARLASTSASSMKGSRSPRKPGPKRPPRPVWLWLAASSKAASSEFVSSKIDAPSALPTANSRIACWRPFVDTGDETLGGLEIKKDSTFRRCQRGVHVRCGQLRMSSGRLEECENGIAAEVGVLRLENIEVIKGGCAVKAEKSRLEGELEIKLSQAQFRQNGIGLLLDSPTTRCEVLGESLFQGNQVGIAYGDGALEVSGARFEQVVIGIQAIPLSDSPRTISVENVRFVGSETWDIEAAGSVFVSVLDSQLSESGTKISATYPARIDVKPAPN